MGKGPVRLIFSYRTNPTVSSLKSVLAPQMGSWNSITGILVMFATVSEKQKTKSEKGTNYLHRMCLISDRLHQIIPRCQGHAFAVHCWCCKDYKYVYDKNVSHNNGGQLNHSMILECHNKLLYLPFHSHCKRTNTQFVNWLVN